MVCVYLHYIFTLHLTSSIVAARMTIQVELTTVRVFSDLIRAALARKGFTVVDYATSLQLSQVGKWGNLERLRLR